MLAEFVKDFKKACDEYGIDILNEFWDNRPDRNADSVLLELMYFGVTFSFEFYVWDNEIRNSGGVTSLMLKGTEYYHAHFSMIESEELCDGPADIEETIDFITNCEIKKRMIKIVHAIDDFFEGYTEDYDRQFIIEYIKMNYDDY